MGECILDHKGGLCPPLGEVNGGETPASADCRFTADSIDEQPDSKSEEMAGSN
jgi:hypothetical protein